MAKITVQLTREELQALVTLTENQFFRMRFIDPKMPGYKARPDELRAAQSAVNILESALRKDKGFKTADPAKMSRKTTPSVSVRIIDARRVAGQ
jgi:hypothetical protein